MMQKAYTIWADGGYGEPYPFILPKGENPKNPTAGYIDLSQLLGKKIVNVTVNNSTIELVLEDDEPKLHCPRSV